MSDGAEHESALVNILRSLKCETFTFIHTYIQRWLVFLSLFPPLAADSNDDDSDEDGDGSYLHPSLFAPKKCSRLEELVKVGYPASLNRPWPRGCL